MHEHARGPRLPVGDCACIPISGAMVSAPGAACRVARVVDAHAAIAAAVPLLATCATHGSCGAGRMGGASAACGADGSPADQVALCGASNCFSHHSGMWQGQIYFGLS